MEKIRSDDIIKVKGRAYRVQEVYSIGGRNVCKLEEITEERIPKPQRRYTVKELERFSRLVDELDDIQVTWHMSEDEAAELLSEIAEIN